MSLKKVNILLLLFTIVMSLSLGICNITYADDHSALTLEQEADKKIKEWMSNTLKNVKVNRYTGDDVHYGIDLGSASNLMKYGFDYDSSTGALRYTRTGSDGANEHCTVHFSASIDLNYDYFTGDNYSDHVTGSCTLTDTNLFSTKTGLQLKINGITKVSKTENVKLNYSDYHNEYKNTEMVYLGPGTSHKAPKEHLFDTKDCKIKLQYSVEGSNLSGEQIPTSTSEVHHNEGFWDRLKAWVNDFLDWGIDQLQKILNLLVLAIAQGIKAVLDMAIGETLTVEKIVYGKAARFSINFWDPNLPPSSIAYKMKDIVSEWFNYFRGLGIAVYLIMLLYAGVKILLSSTSKGIDDAKEKLVAWILGIMILFMGPLLMKYVIEINDSLVTLVSQKNNSIQGASSGTDMMQTILDKAKEEGLLLLTIIYIIMIGQLIILIINYYKRAFMVAFLITIFPIISTFYVWEKTQRGAASSLKNWTKEFCVLVFTQLVHAVVYAVLIEGMYDALIGEDGGNYILYILCVTFLFKAEGIVKQIFNVRSVAGTVGDLAASGATAFAVTKSISSVFQKQPSGADQQDTADEKAATDQLNTIRDNTKANAIRKQVESEEANRDRNGTDGFVRGSGSNGQDAGGSNVAGGPGGSDSGVAPVITPDSLSNGGINAQTVGPDLGAQTQVAVNAAPAAQTTPTISTTAQNRQRANARREMSDLEKARLVYRQKALKAKNGGRVRKIAKFAVRNAARTAGITAGLAMGLAQGDVGKAVTSAATFGTIGAKLGNGVNRITDAGIGRYAGARMRMKAENGEYKNDLKKAGVSDEFIEQVYNNARGEAIKKALAKEMSGVRRGGRVLGEVKFVGTMEKETRDQE